MIEIKFDGAKLEQALLKAVGDTARNAAVAKAATRVAAAARQEVIQQMSKIFDRPTPFTLHSVRYAAASPDDRAAKVFISDDANHGLSPRKYLGPEIMGGGRNMKRSERAMVMQGIMTPDQHWVPSTRMGLDSYGNVRGSLVAQIMSRIKAFGEQGYSANVTDKTKAKLKKQGKSVRISGTEYFVARSRWDERNLGIWKLVGPGKVQPVLLFVNRQPEYHTRFPFAAIVEKVANERFHDEIMRALLEGIR